MKDKKINKLRAELNARIDQKVGTINQAVDDINAKLQGVWFDNLRKFLENYDEWNKEIEELINLRLLEHNQLLQDVQNYKSSNDAWSYRINRRFIDIEKELWTANKNFRDIKNHLNRLDPIIKTIRIPVKVEDTTVQLVDILVRFQCPECGAPFKEYEASPNWKNNYISVDLKKYEFPDFIGSCDHNCFGDNRYLFYVKDAANNGLNPEFAEGIGKKWVK